MPAEKRPWYLRKKFQTLKVSISRVDTRAEAHRLVDMIFDMNDHPDLPYEMRKQDPVATIRNPDTGKRWEESVSYCVIRGYKDFRHVRARVSKKRKEVA